MGRYQVEALHNGEILTTTQVAKVMGISSATVADRVDKGIIPGWRVPGSKVRRIDRARLIAWARAREIPLDWELITPLYCGHGVVDGEWCAECNAAYKAARVAAQEKEPGN